MNRSIVSLVPTGTVIAVGVVPLYTQCAKASTVFGLLFFSLAPVEDLRLVSASEKAGPRGLEKPELTVCCDTDLVAGPAKSVSLPANAPPAVTPTPTANANTASSSQSRVLLIIFAGICSLPHLSYRLTRV